MVTQSLLKHGVSQTLRLPPENDLSDNSVKYSRLPNHLYGMLHFSVEACFTVTLDLELARNGGHQNRN